MLHNAILLENGIQHFKRPAAVNHEILRDNLEPIDHRFLGENMAVMGNTQTDADPVIGKVIEQNLPASLVIFAPEPGNRTPALEATTLRLWLAAIGRAAALTLTRVFTFAAVITRLAAPFALTGVLPLASVLFLCRLCRLQRDTRLHGRNCRVGRGSERTAH